MHARYDRVTSALNEAAKSLGYQEPDAAGKAVRADVSYDEWLNTPAQREGIREVDTG